jgi:hypothetical protein
VHRAGQRAGDEPDVAAGAGDDLQVHPLAPVLAGVEGPVRGDPVDGVRGHRPGARRTSLLSPRRRPPCAVSRARAARSPAIADQEGLLHGFQLPPARPDRGPGGGGRSPPRSSGSCGTTAAQHDRKAQEPLVAMKVVLVGCLIYPGLPRSLERPGVPSPDRDHSPRPG